MGWRESKRQGEALFPTIPLGDSSEVVGWVYIAGAYERDQLVFVKIGFTAAKNPHTRIKGIAQGTPHEVRLLVATTGTRMLELQYHREFHKSHVRGEWFAPTPEIMIRVETLMSRRDSWKPWWGKPKKPKEKRFRHAR